MANYFADMVASEPEVLAEESILESMWDWLSPILLKIAESWVTYLLAAGTFGLGAILVFLRSTLKKHWGYLFGYGEKVPLMEEKLSTLLVIKSGVEKKQKEGFVANVHGWLYEVNRVKEKVDQLKERTNYVPHVFNVINRYFGGKAVGETIVKIDSLIAQKFEWHKDPHARIRVPPKRTSDSQPSPAPYEKFASRKLTFSNVMNAFGDGNVRMIGIWGPGGTGKTTMKNQLRETAQDMCLFEYIVDVDVGKKGDLKKVQQSLADELEMQLEQIMDESSATEEEKRRIQVRRMKKLSAELKSLTNDGKKVLIILDNMHEGLEMEPLGLGPLAKNNCFKLLLTTRDKNVCQAMGVTADATFKMEAMPPSEAWLLLQQLTCISENASRGRDLRKTGEEIVELCGRLPIAIKFIADSLRRDSSEEAWINVRDELTSGSTSGQQKLFKVLEIRYMNLSRECQQIFLLCCYFPPEHGILHEDLVRYGRGLRLFDGMNFMYTRKRVHDLINELKSTNFLDIGKLECLKLHDLVRDFGLQHVPHDIVATPLAKGAFTSDNYIKFLKLVGRCNDLVFPKDFSVVMQKLQILAQKYPHQPWPPRPDQHFDNLQSLFRNNLQFRKIEMIGNLRNLEILSFAGSDIEFFPANMGELSELRLLDLTGCKELGIHDDVLPSLKKLEELYMGASRYRSGLKLTDSNFSSFSKISGNLKALELDFNGDTSQAQGTNFEKLKQFRISIGPQGFTSSYDQIGNILKLAVEKELVLRWKINVLFRSAEIIVLEVGNLIHLSEFLQPSEGEICSFECLKELELTHCNQLKSFWHSMKNGLVKLESLKIQNCEVLEEIVGDGGGEDETIPRRKMEFPRLRKLSLKDLPKLVTFCRGVEVELCQLEVLELEGLPKITCIFPKSSSANSDSSASVQSLFNQRDYACALREMKIRRCDGLENIFSTNLIRHLQKLEELEVERCSSLQEVFNLRDAETNEFVGGQTITSCCSFWERILPFISCQRDRNPIASLPTLRSIEMIGCENFVHLVNPSSCNNLIQLSFLRISDCKNFRDMDSKLESDSIDKRSGGLNNNEFVIQIKPETNSMRTSTWHSQSEFTYMELVNDEGIVTVLPSNLIPRFCHLKGLGVHSCGSVEEVFDMEFLNCEVTANNDEGGQNGNKAVVEVLNDLERLELGKLANMTHVWKCWKNSISIKCFQRLTHISIHSCERLEYLFTPLIAKALVNLQELEITKCEKIAKIVSDREETEGGEIYINSSFFPNLAHFKLTDLQNLKRIDGGRYQDGRRSNDASSSTAFPSPDSQEEVQIIGQAVEAAVSSLCNSNVVCMVSCNLLLHAIPYYAVKRLQKLKELSLDSCPKLVEVFQSEGIPTSQLEGNVLTVKNLEKMDLKYLSSLQCIWRRRSGLALHFPLLKEVVIDGCHELTHVFSWSTFSSLKALESINIRSCSSMKEIVKEEGEDCEADVFFGNLKSLRLYNLKIHRFSSAKLTFDRQRLISEINSSSSSEEDRIFDPRNAEHKLERAGEELEIATRVLCNSKIIYLSSCHSLRYVIPSIEIKQLHKLEQLEVYHCCKVIEVFQSQGISNTHSEGNGHVTISKLQKVWFIELQSLEYIWRSRDRLVLQFPSLKEVEIRDCPKLTHVFSFSAVASLQNLEQLKVSKCSKMEVIVTGEDEDREATEFMFSRLRILVLDNLESLRAISSGTHSFVSPVLEKRDVRDCPMLTNSD